MKENVKYGVIEINKFLEASALNSYIYKQIRTSVWNVKYLNSGAISIGHSGIMWEDISHAGEEYIPKQYVLDVNGSSYFHNYCKINNTLEVIKDLKVLGFSNFSDICANVINSNNSKINQLTCNIVNVSNSLTNYGITTLNNLNVSGTTLMLGTLNVSNIVNIDGVLNLSNNAIINGNTTIYGNLNVSTNTNISGNTTVKGVLNVLSNTNIHSNLNVSRNVTVIGNTLIHNNLNVSNDLNISGTTDIYGYLNVHNNVNISGNTYIDGSLNVSNDMQINGLFIPKKIRMKTTTDYTTDKGRIADITIGGNSITYLESLYVGDIRVLRNFDSDAVLNIYVPPEVKSEKYTTLKVNNIVNVSNVSNVSVVDIYTRSIFELGAAYNNNQAARLEANAYGGFMLGIYNASSTVTTSFFDMSANSNTEEGGRGILYNGPVEFYTPNLLLDGNLNITGNIYSYSDKNIKDNITKLENCLSKISNIHGYSFTRKDLSNMSALHIGLIAQEVESIFPEIVQQKNNIKSINYPSIVAILIESIKELNSEFLELKINFNELKNNLLQNKIL